MARVPRRRDEATIARETEEAWTVDVLAHADAMMRKVRDRIGVGFALRLPAPVGNRVLDEFSVEWCPLRLVAVGPNAIRRASHTSLHALFSYMLEYEDRAERDGETAAEQWHKEQRAIREGAISRAIQKGGPG
jgi:hypothetical protein